jgi:hypothetical protein
MNMYSKAVDYIQEYIAATDSVFEDGGLPGVETSLEYAMKVLKSHQDYDGRNPECKKI